MDFDVTRQSTARKAVRVYAVLLAVLFAIAILAVIIQSRRGLGYPYDTFLFDPAHRFSDFSIFAFRFRTTSGPQDYFKTFGDGFNYGAPAFLAFTWLSKTFAYPWGLLLLIVPGTAIASGALLARATRGWGFRIAIALTVVLCYPLMYTMDRGNFEGMIWPVLILAFWLFAKRLYYFSAAVFGLVAAIKFFPAILFLLFFQKKRYRELAFGVVVFAAATYGSLVWIGPTPSIAAAHLAAGMAKFKDQYTLDWEGKEIGFDHSIFAIWKQILVMRYGNYDPVIDWLEDTVNLYAGITLGGFIALYWFRLRKLPLLNSVTACLVAMVVLPYVSYDYTLSHLYVAWALFLLYLAKGDGSLTLREMLLFLVPYAILFSPQSYLLWETVGYGGQLKAFALIGLLYAAAKYPLPLPLLDGEA